MIKKGKKVKLTQYIQIYKNNDLLIHSSQLHNGVERK